jgi:hypothetical protein
MQSYERTDEIRATVSKSLRKKIQKKCPFYMVDGLTIEEVESTPINTHSGVLTESELMKLQ